jgi:hypothetical protein
MKEIRRTGIDYRLPEHRKIPGPKTRVNEEQIAESVRNLLRERPDLSQKQVSEFLMEHSEVKLELCGVSRYLKKYAIPHKQMIKLYRNTKLVVSRDQPNRCKTKKKNIEQRSEIEIAAGALVKLPMASSSTTYRSPYAPPTRPQRGYQIVPLQRLPLQRCIMASIHDPRDLGDFLGMTIGIGVMWWSGIELWRCEELEFLIPKSSPVDGSMSYEA